MHVHLEEEFAQHAAIWGKGKQESWESKKHEHKREHDDGHGHPQRSAQAVREAAGSGRQA